MVQLLDFVDGGKVVDYLFDEVGTVACLSKIFVTKSKSKVV